MLTKANSAILLVVGLSVLSGCSHDKDSAGTTSGNVAGKPVEKAKDESAAKPVTTQDELRKLRQVLERFSEPAPAVEGAVGTGEVTADEIYRVHLAIRDKGLVKGWLPIVRTLAENKPELDIWIDPRAEVSWKDVLTLIGKAHASEVDTIANFKPHIGEPVGGNQFPHVRFPKDYKVTWFKYGWCYFAVPVAGEWEGKVIALRADTKMVMRLSQSDIDGTATTNKVLKVSSESPSTDNAP